MKRPKIAVFISGTGSNLATVLECPWQNFVTAVVSSKRSAAGLGKARGKGIPTHVISPKPTPSEWDLLTQWLRERDIDGIFLAGFMRVLPVSFVETWKDRMVNIHPSFLPTYPGLNSIQRAFAANDLVGVTIHKVTAEVDAGEILSQATVTRNPQFWNEQTCETLVHAREHTLLRRILDKWVSSLTSY